MEISYSSDVKKKIDVENKNFAEPGQRALKD